ncbi:hypothetical protein AMECASPLE_022314 [Ameca splendens]|uniref:Uncharacterized protein n=1 Tax=Ameca splendens TaxID=208324 RepID=A0ABV0YR35_9TELE
MFRNHYCTIRSLFTSPSNRDSVDHPTSLFCSRASNKNNPFLSLCLTAAAQSAGQRKDTVRLLMVARRWLAGVREAWSRCPQGCLCLGIIPGGTGFSLLAREDKHSLHMLRDHDKRIASLNYI